MRSAARLFCSETSLGSLCTKSSTTINSTGKKKLYYYLFFKCQPYFIDKIYTQSNLQLGPQIKTQSTSFYTKLIFCFITFTFLSILPQNPGLRIQISVIFHLLQTSKGNSITKDLSEFDQKLIYGVMQIMSSSMLCTRSLGIQQSGCLHLPLVAMQTSFFVSHVSKIQMYKQYKQKCNYKTLPHKDSNLLAPMVMGYKLKT